MSPSSGLTPRKGDFTISLQISHYILRRLVLLMSFKKKKKTLVSGFVFRALTSL